MIIRKIIGIVTKKTAEVEETVPIRVIFMNTGEKEVISQFKGRISYGENIFQLLESEKINVPISGTNEFSFYFTPNKAGKYIISGRAFYSGKKTFESSTSIEIISKKFQIKPFIIFAIYTLLIVIILFLFYKIRKEKRIFSNKLKKIKWK